MGGEWHTNHKQAVACTSMCGKITLLIIVWLFSVLELNRSQIKGADVLSNRLLHASVMSYVHSCYNLQNMPAQMHTKLFLKNEMYIL